MSDFNQTDTGATERDNLVMFPSAQNFPSTDRRDPIQGLIEEFEIIESEVAEDIIDELARAGAEVLDQDLNSLNLSEIMELTHSQLSILKETGERIDYLLREIESFLPRKR